jgi:hypothetical protein
MKNKSFFSAFFFCALNLAGASTPDQSGDLALQKQILENFSAAIENNNEHNWRELNETISNNPHLSSSYKERVTEKGSLVRCIEEYQNNNSLCDQRTLLQLFATYQAQVEQRSYLQRAVTVLDRARTMEDHEMCTLL